MGGARLLIGVPLAGAVTITLFFIMQMLIAGSDEGPKKLAESTKIEFVREAKDDSTQTKDREPERPRAQEQPPPPPMDMAKASKPSKSGIRMPNLGKGLKGFNLGAAISDRDSLPLVRIAPQYPRRALERGIEGWIIVEFSVSKTGVPFDPVVIDAEPRGYFDSAAKRAIVKFKYKPRVESGEPVVQHGIQNLFTFKIDPNAD